jgi:hypothetical protein
MWFDLAARHLVQASILLDDVATDMAPEKIYEAQELARQWLLSN